MTNVFTKIFQGLKWAGNELKNLVVEVPLKLSKLIILSNDAEQISSDAANEVIILSGDVVALVAAAAEDDGASLTALEGLVSAALAAGVDKLANFTEDVAVVAAASTFFKSLNSANFPDVLKQVAKVIADGKSLSETVITDFEKLKKDAQ